MKITTLAGANSSGEPQRSTAYYYADLEKIKKRNEEKDNLECQVHNTYSTIQKKKDIDHDNAIETKKTEFNRKHDHQTREIFRNPFQDLDDQELNLAAFKDPDQTRKYDQKNRENKDVFRNPFKNLDDIDLSCKDYERGRVRVLSFDRDRKTRENRDNCLKNRQNRDTINLSLKDLGPTPNQQEFNRERAHLNLNLENPVHRTRYNDRDRDNTETQNVLSEYVDANEVVNDGAVREVPPLRDRQWSLPEYSTPERKEETYSTAGTFPMPEPKEKEPLLAELEIVGRLPLTQLEGTGVRRSRSWYLCCPNVGDDELSRDSSWRYASLRPVTVTAPPTPGQNDSMMVAAQSHSSRGGEDPTALRAERDALARALAAERSRAAAAARAHDARLAELHGVIAELVRRRAQGKGGAIPEEEVEDECESTTQPACELEPEDGTSPRDSTSLTSEDKGDTSGDCGKIEITEPPCVEVMSACDRLSSQCESCLRINEKDSQLCLSAARCCQSARCLQESRGSSCEREHGSADHRVYTAGRCESRQAKVASRVRLRKTEHDVDGKPNGDERWACDALCGSEAERLALEVCAHADLREALLAARHMGMEVCAREAVWRVRCGSLAADCALLRAATARATDTAHRLSVWCALQESSCVAVCSALRAADRALETYDVLLALAETSHQDTDERAAAELVACRLLQQLETESPATLGEPLLPPGPWLSQLNTGAVAVAWSAARERRLRAHAARLKADTVTLRGNQPPPAFFTYHDGVESSESISEVEKPSSKDIGLALDDMEAAIVLQEALLGHELEASKRLEQVTGAHIGPTDHHIAQKDVCCRKAECANTKEQRAAETDL